MEKINSNNKISLSEMTPFLILLAMYVGSYVIALPLAVKIMAIGPLVIPGGYIAASITYPCTDIVDEVYGERFANWMVTCGLIAIVVVLILIFVDAAMPEADFWELSKSYKDIFDMSYRLIIAGLVAFVLGQYADVYLFSRIRELTSNRWLWLRNNLSTAISKLLDAVSFNFIGFYGIYETSELISMTFSTYIFYLLLAIVDTPLVYLGVWWIYKKFPQLKDNT
jgi:uncharacterized integral membrane protein (TIGR00697 family)